MMADQDASTWVKLHRAITEWQWYTKPNTMRLFIHLLIKANHDDSYHRGTLVRRGEVFTGRKKLAKELDLSEREIRSAISHLLGEEIAIRSTNKYSIITINNYDNYQSSQPTKATNKQSDKRQTSDQQATSKRPANDHIQELKELKELKEPKEPKEEENVYRAFAHLSITIEEVEKLKSDGYSSEQIDDILDSIENTTANKKYRKLYLTAKNWLKREPKKGSSVNRGSRSDDLDRFLEYEVA